MVPVQFPEPAIWCRSEEFEDALIKRQSFNGWRTKYSDADMELFTKEQVLELFAAYRDAISDAALVRREMDALSQEVDNLSSETPKYVWMVATKTFLALFDTRETADRACNSNAGASTYIPPVAVPVFTAGLPK